MDRGGSAAGRTLSWEAGGLFAAALVAECGPRAGWSAPWCDLLRRLRAAESAEVAHTAHEIYTAPE